MKHNGRELSPQVSIAGHLNCRGDTRLMKRAMNVWLIAHGLRTQGYGEFNGRTTRECIERRQRKAER